MREKTLKSCCVLENAFDPSTIMCAAQLAEEADKPPLRTRG